MFRKNTKVGLAALAALALSAGAASAAPVMFAGTGTSSDGTAVAASALFSMADATTLQITLTNTSTLVNSNPDVLTGVLWNTQTNTDTFTPLSVVISAGSAAVGGTTTDGTNISGEYAYRGDMTTIGSPTNAVKYGVSAAGYSTDPGGGFGSTDAIFPTSGNGDRFNPTGGTPPDGLTGGLVPNASFANFAYVDNSIVISLTVASGFDPLANIKSVYFGYGTAPESVSTSKVTSIPTPVPLPAAVWSGLSVLGGLALFGRFRKRVIA